MSNNTLRKLRASADRGFLCAALAAGLAAGCAKKDEPAAKPRAAAEAVAVTVRAVSAEPTRRGVDVQGTLYGAEEAAISAKVSGRVSAVFKDVGDPAEPGEVLAEIDGTDYELVVRQKDLAVREALAKLGLTEMPSSDFDAAKVPAVQRARLQAANAEAKFNRGKQLHESRPPLISDQDFADLETAAAVASSNYDVELLNARALLAEAAGRKADLDVAKQGLIDTVVATPHAKKTPAGASAATPLGYGGDLYAVAARMVSVGEYVQAGTALFRLVDTDPVKLRATAPERYVSQVAVGQKANVFVESHPEPFEGQVSRINPQIDVASRTFQVEIVVPNPRNVLRPGAFARAWIGTRTDADAVFVPADAVTTFAGLSKVFTVRDGKAAEVVVELGERTGEKVEVTKGLKPGDSIVVEGANRLAGGVPVTVGPGPTTNPAARTAAVR